MLNKELERLYFSVDISTRKMLRSSEIEDVDQLTFDEFYEQYLSPSVLEAMEEEYSLETLWSLMSSCEKRESYIFLSADGATSYSFSLRKFKSAGSIIFCDFQKTNTYAESGLNPYKDYLTGLFNRGYLVEKINAQLGKKADVLGALIIIDLNHFKIVNDTSGHKVGDECLRTVATKLREICCGHLLGRYGGDEFIVFIHNTSEEQVKELCQKIIEMSVDFSDGEHDYSISCSCGVALESESESSFTTLLDLADEALYKAKQGGRDSAYLKGVPIASKGTVKKQRKTFDITLNSFKDSRLFHEEIRFQTIINLVLIVLFSLVFCGSFIMLGVYVDTNMRKETTNEADTMITTIAEQVSRNTVNQIDSLFVELTMANSVFISSTASDADETIIDANLQQITSTVSFARIALILDDEQLYLDRDHIYSLADNPVAESVMGDDYFVGNFTVASMGKMVLFALPYGTMTLKDGPGSMKVSGSDVVGLIGIISPNDLSNLISTSGFDNSTYVMLGDYDGNIIVSSNNVPSYMEPNNIFDSFDKYVTDEEYFKIKQEVHDGAAKLVTIDLATDECFFYYGTLEGSDDSSLNAEWRVFIFVPSRLVLANVRSIFNRQEVLLWSISGVLLLLAIGSATLMLYYRNNGKRLQYTDSLTGGINQERFVIDCKKLMSRRKASYALVYFNFLRFKYVTEQFGLNISDHMIKDTYEIIKERLSKDEVLGHAYADRFMFILKNEGKQVIDARVREITEAIRVKLLEQYKVSCRASVGVYFTEPTDTNFNSIMDRARIAQESAKSEYGFVNIGYFNEDMIVEEVESSEMEQTAEIALVEGQFIVYYQPKWNLQKTKWSGFEALVRWKDPHKGMIAPDKFIPLFEKNGFINKLDLYVFEQVCKDIKGLVNYGYTPLQVSVNVSRVQLMQPAFLDDYERILKKYEIEPSLIEFELTETAAFNNREIMLETITKIHLMGCVCSLDDFGSGYSSINMLNDYDFDIIKLDRSLFMGAFGFNEKSKMIIKTIVALSHNLGKRIVAEGVENDEQINFLKEIGCDYVQSFYYGKPQPLSEYRKILRGGQLEHDGE